MFTLKCFRATEKWKQRDVEAVFAKLCEHIFDIFIFLLSVSTHTCRKLAPREIDTIECWDGPRCWQIYVVHGSVTHTRTHAHKHARTFVWL